MPNNEVEKNQEITLYRKHRPQALSEISGQQHILAVLKNALAEGKIAHAYLFAGPRGTGKTTIARIIAKRLNCQNSKDSEPCGVCDQCVSFARKASLDLIEIDAASNRGIDEIRALKDKISLAPAAGKYKIYIIDEVHMLTTPAFNALLKTLEEPPSHAIFILATTELHKVPDTIKSRCQTFLFRRASVALIIERLRKISNAEKITIEDGALALIASHSEGCFRDAESLLGQVISTQNVEVVIADVENMLGVVGFEQVQKFVDTLLVKDARGAVSFLQKVIERGSSLRRFADDITRYLRAVASYSAAGVHSETFDPEVESNLQKQTKNNPTDTFVKILRLFLRAKAEMRDATYEELPLELAIIEWCEGGKAAPPTIVASASVSAPTVVKNESPALNTVTVENAPVTPKSHIFSFGKKQSPLEQNIMADNPQLFEKIMCVWRQFLERTAQLNPLLISTLEACRPSIVRGNILYLITEFNLYKERISENKVREPLENLLAEISGEKILIRVAHKSEAALLKLPQEEVTVTENKVMESVKAESSMPQQKSSEPLNATAEALAVLGGELISG
jgi:DNA polymerase-3 subunit gamma/tau